MIKKYPKGSQWRKCDLHVHTALDHEWLNAPDLNIAGAKENFAKEFVQCAVSEGLELIAITDHNFCNELDELLLPYIQEEASLHNLTVLPGFEITVQDGSGIHVLVIFAESTSLHSIHELIKRLFAINTVLQPSSGIVPVSVNNLDEIKRILDNSGLNYLFIFAHADRKNGVLDGETITGSRRMEEWLNPAINICQLSKSPAEYTSGFLYNVINKKDPNYSRCMTYIIASDCRSLSKTGLEEGRHYLGQKFTWIKCDPTFEGLKQIIYEPETRVRIQENKPEQKETYLTIDRITFTNGGAKFQSTPVELNDKLNSIIGGKSSGKSLLLYYIAKTVDPMQVSKRLREMELEEPYDFEKVSEMGFEVIWSDGAKHSLNDGGERQRQITYIPQMYINHIAEHRGDKELDQLVESILVEKDAFRKFLEDQRKQISAARADTTSQVIKYFQQLASIQEKENAIRNRGDKTARELNLKQKGEELQELRLESNFSPEDEKAFTEASSGKLINQDRLARLQSLEAILISEYAKTVRILETSADSAFSSLSTLSASTFYADSVIQQILGKLIERHRQLVGNTLKDIADELRVLLSKITRLKLVLGERIAYFETKLGPFLQKITKREKLQLLQEAIKTEETELAQIKILEQERAGLEAILIEIKDTIINDYKRLFKGYEEIVAKVNQGYAIISEEKRIKLKAVIGFDKEKFKQNCTVHLDKRKYLSETVGEYFGTDNEYLFIPESHIDNITGFFERVLSGTLTFNQSGNQAVVCERMFDDYFNLHFELFQQNESIFRMSPGKKGLILMYLILHLSNASYPILIDQPEDNLDNRTVYTELKEFIKSKKIDRQIIMVTHNANLVVPTDSENVIVANQSGQDVAKENGSFQFEYVSGALENTFLNHDANGILHKKGIREHVCEILEGGEDAFKERELRYGMN